MNLQRPYTEIINAFVGLVGVALIGYFIFRLIALFLKFLTDVQPAFAVAILGAMTTLLVGIGGGLLTHYHIRKRQAEEAHREEKVKLYGGFLDMAAAHVAQENKAIKQRKIPQQELLKFFMKYKTGLVLRGSPGVIRAMARFEDVSAEGGDVLGAVDDIYRAIREDLGLSNRGLKKYELVGVYLKKDDRQQLLR